MTNTVFGDIIFAMLADAGAVAVTVAWTLSPAFTPKEAELCSGDGVDIFGQLVAVVLSRFLDIFFDCLEVFHFVFLSYNY